MSSSNGATNGEESTVPTNANEGCVGPTSTDAGKASACAGCPNQTACSTGAFSSPEALAAQQAETDSIRSSLSSITHVILVLSGKGGVGKSTVCCQLAHTLASRGYHVGVLDVDLCGPSAPRMLGVSGREVHKSAYGWTPVYANENLAVMSISFLLADGDSAVVWRGPRKNGLIKQFLTETDWTSSSGEESTIDYLLVDTPPGTSDEHISTVQLLQKVPDLISGAIVVTTPEEVSMADVRKELNFCQKTKVKVLGIVENMGKFQTTLSDLTFTKRINGGEEETGGQEKTGEEVDVSEQVRQTLREKCPELLDMIVSADVFPPSGGGPRAMAHKYDVPYLGSLPLDPNLLKSCEDGVCFVDEFGGGSNGSGSPAVNPLNRLVDGIVDALPVDDDDEVDMVVE